MKEKRKYFLFYILFGIISTLLISSCHKEVISPYCQISFPVKNNYFLKGSIIPVKIDVGNSNSHVQLYINDLNIGAIETSPNIYYIESNNIPIGTNTVKAIYTTQQNTTITDEKTIDLFPVDMECPTEVYDIDGNMYHIVQIGNQCWMQENLKTTRYHNGQSLIDGRDSIVDFVPNGLPGWYFVYDNDIQNANTYGYLYNWVTLMNGNRTVEKDSIQVQGICPDGWHVPSVTEWESLIDYVGGAEIAADMLKDTSGNYWTRDLIQFETKFEFNALPGGNRVGFANMFIELNSSAYFWSATPTIPNHAYYIYFGNGSRVSIIGRMDSKRFGYSVRCIKNY